MDLDSVSQKRFNELEQITTQLLKTMHSAKLQDSSLYPSLQEFERELGDARRKRYDSNNTAYQGY